MAKRSVDAGISKALNLILHFVTIYSEMFSSPRESSLGANTCC